MITFDNESLFGPGPCRFRIGPVRLRHALQQMPGSLGTKLDPQGTEARRITQTGVLLADDVPSLRAQADAIRQKLDGRAYELVDDLGRTWPDTVMLGVEAEDFVRIGARWKVHYTIEYVQTLP